MIQPNMFISKHKKGYAFKFLHAVHHANNEYDKKVNP